MKTTAVVLFVSPLAFLQLDKRRYEFSILPLHEITSSSIDRRRAIRID